MRRRDIAPDPNKLLEVSCLISPLSDTKVILFAAAHDLLERLEETCHVGNDDHPNKLELEAQRALIRHAIRHQNSFRLYDDHWGRTGFVLLDMFEQGRARMQIDSTMYLFSEVTKETWERGTDPMMMVGGFLYRDSAGSIVYQQQTWLS